MSAKKKPSRTSGEVDAGERIKDGRKGLKRTEDLVRRLLKVPKSDIEARPPRPLKDRGGTS